MKYPLSSSNVTLSVTETYTTGFANRSESSLEEKYFPQFITQSFKSTDNQLVTMIIFTPARSLCDITLILTFRAQKQNYH